MDFLMHVLPMRVLVIWYVLTIGFSFTFVTLGVLLFAGVFDTPRKEKLLFVPTPSV